MKKILISISFILLIQGCAVTPFEKEYYTEFLDRGAYGYQKGLKCGNDWLEKEKEIARFEKWKKTGIIDCVKDAHAPRGSITLTEAEELEIDYWLIYD